MTERRNYDFCITHSVPNLQLVPTDLELFNETELKIERDNIWNKFNDNRAKRILYVSDLHIPFHDSKCVKQALQEKADMCIVGGDFLDLYGISTFKKDRLIPVQREISDGLTIINILSDTYPYVLFLMANHEKRLLKLLQNKLYDRTDIVEFLKNATNVLSQMAQPYQNIYVINNWWCKIGQMIFCHPDYYTKIRTKTVQNSYEFFTSIGEEFQGINNAHTHHLGKIVYFNKLCIENPCLCHIMDYLLDGHKYNAEWVKGYSIVQLDKDGNIDDNETRIFRLK